LKQLACVDDPAAQVETVHEASVESLIEGKAIGSTLRRMRLKRSMGLVDLGELSGLSASYLSQLETGRVVPTIRNLTRIAMVFKVDLSVFFREPKSPEFKISRDSERIRLSSGVRGTPFMLSQSMSALIPGRRIVPCIAELLPDAGDQVFESRLGQGVEFAFVMEGMVRVSTPQNSEVLEPHDVLWLAADVKRTYQCAGPAIAKVMIISFPHLRNPLHEEQVAL
jgi:transcriptional regulator with XRE-family HTH domain